jgi:hypothetical protein
MQLQELLTAMAQEQQQQQQATAAPASRFKSKQQMIDAAGSEGLVRLHFAASKDKSNLYAHKSFLRCCSGVMKNLLDEESSLVSAPQQQQPSKVAKLQAGSSASAAAAAAAAAAAKAADASLPLLPMPDDDTTAWEEALALMYPMPPGACCCAAGVLPSYCAGKYFAHAFAMIACALDASTLVVQNLVASSAQTPANGRQFWKWCKLSNGIPCMSHSTQAASNDASCDGWLLSSVSAAALLVALL